jgi:hypothetical protein
MDGEKKRRRGWWALAGIGVLTLVGLYVGAYYALVQRQGYFSETPSGTTFSILPGYGPLPHCGRFHPVTRPLFWPIHQIDRRLRPGEWESPPYPVPRP